MKIQGLFDDRATSAPLRTAHDLMQRLSLRHEIGWAITGSWGADVVLTHAATVREAAELGGQIVVLVHHEDEARDLNPERIALLVFASHWLKARVRWEGMSHVLGPVLCRQDWRTCPYGDTECPCADGDLCHYEPPEAWPPPKPELRDATTLVNLRPDKGAALLYEMAGRLPDRRFIGVEGSRAGQLPPPLLLANLEIVPHPADMRSVLARTRVLLSPSSYEGGSRLMQEACAAGVPVVSAPRDAREEFLGEVGLYASRERPSEWYGAIRMLDDEKTWARARESALSVARNFDCDLAGLAFEGALTAALQRRSIAV